MKLLHIYGQVSFHDEAIIVANKEALLQLKTIIDKTFLKIIGHWRKINGRELF